MKTNTYFLKTGDADRLRLEILNKLYNPDAQAFMLASGLDKGMTVLEIGCGTGHMACWLANQVGPTGKVIAIDSSSAQLNIARMTAKKFGADNIDFQLMDVMDLAQKNFKYDFTFGRWVLFFIKNPELAVELIYDKLNTNGIFSYESASISESGYFCYPPEEVISKWHEWLVKNFSELGLDGDFILKLNHLLKKLGSKNIKIKTSQAVLVTPEEKSVYRLGALTTKDTMMQNNNLSEQDYDNVIAKLSVVEESDTIIGFFRNILISGIKN